LDRRPGTRWRECGWTERQDGPRRTSGVGLLPTVLFVSYTAPGNALPTHPNSLVGYVKDAQTAALVIRRSGSRRECGLLGVLAVGLGTIIRPTAGAVAEPTNETFRCRFALIYPISPSSVVFEFGSNGASQSGPIYLRT
jgi:hypothetical protein